MACQIKSHGVELFHRQVHFHDISLIKIVHTIIIASLLFSLVLLIIIGLTIVAAILHSPALRYNVTLLCTEC